MKLIRRIAAALSLLLVVAAAVAGDATPDGLIQQLSSDVMSAVKGDKALQAGDTKKINAMVDVTIMPHVDFERMTASAVGHYWNQASADQKLRLQAQFKQLLMRTYSGAVAQIKDQKVVLKPLRAQPDATEVVVQTLIKGNGDPLQLDYRLEKLGVQWKIYDVNVMGAWLVQNYKSSFAQEISSSGIDGLIAKLAERNKANADAVKSASKS